MGRLGILESYRVKEDILRNGRQKKGERRNPNVTYLQDRHPPDFQPKKKNENQQEKKTDREREALH